MKNTPQHRRFLSHKLICIPTFDRPDSICDFVYQTAKELAYQNVVIILALGENWRGRSGWQTWKQRIQDVKSAKEGQSVTIGLFHFLPFQRFEFVRQLNAQLNYWYLVLLLESNFSSLQKIFWMFHPRESHLLSFFKTWHVHFDCVDWHSSPDRERREQLDRQRRRLIDQADSITAITEPVRQRISALKGIAPPIVPQGFDISGFEQTEPLSSETERMLTRVNGKTIVGFFGGMNQRLDTGMLIEVAQQHPTLSFLFVGPRGTDENVSQSADGEVLLDKLLEQPNVLWIPSLKRNQLLPLMERCDVLTIPYDLQWEFNYCCYPMKVMEYFFAEKPILSTSIPSLLPFSQITFADTADEWSKKLETLIKKPLSAKQQSASQEIARSQTWKKKLDSVDVYLSEMLRSS